MRRVALPAFFLLAASCAPAPPTAPDTSEDGWGPSLSERDGPPKKPVAPRALPIAESKRERWARADEMPKLSLLSGRSPSEHLDGVFDRTVMVDAAVSGYRTLTATTTMVAGALIVQRHHPRGAERVIAYFIMEKLEKGARPHARDWRFLVVDEKLRVAADQQLSLCARCHADAPFNGLFGVGRAPDAP